MEECPNCHNWTLVYEPQGEVHRCYTCEHRVPEKYEKYIKRMDCARQLHYPSIHPALNSKKESGDKHE